MCVRPPLPELHLNPISSILLHLTLDLHLNLRSDVGYSKRSEILCLPQKNEKNVVVQKSRIYFGPTKSIHKFISHVWKINTELLWPWYLKPMREENFDHVTWRWQCAFWLVIVDHAVLNRSAPLVTWPRDHVTWSLEIRHFSVFLGPTNSYWSNSVVSHP